MIAELKTCYEPFCLGVNTHIAIAQQHMAMLETESNIGLKSTSSVLAEAIRGFLHSHAGQAGT